MKTAPYRIAESHRADGQHPQQPRRGTINLGTAWRPRSGPWAGLVLSLAALLLVACGDGSALSPTTACLNSSDPSLVTALADQSDDRITITNNPDTLDALITCGGTTILVDSAGSSPLRTLAPAATSFDLTLVAEAAPPSIVGTAAFLGAGLNDAVAGGAYTGTSLAPPYVRYVVKIDGAPGTPSPDTFSWSEDDGATWIATGVAITGAAQALSNGVTVTFGATTGHTLGDQWHIDAGITQATSVSMSGNTAVVSFSMIGAPFLGAIQVYSLTGNTARLKSQALFRDMDVNAVSTSSGSVYAVGAHEPVDFAAVVQELGISGANLTLGGLPIELTSFAGTGVVHDATRSKLLVTDGNTGGLSYLNDSTLATVSYDALLDARGVGLEGDTAVVVQGTVSPTQGQITVFDLSGGTPASPVPFLFTGADVAEAKSTVEVLGGKAFVAAGSGGAQVLSTANGALLATVANPTGTGLPDANVVANAVSVDGDLMFISHGEAGVYVAQNAAGDFSLGGANSPVTLTELGGLQFGSLESVNHVEYKSGYLFVAAGLGGIKIVSVTIP